MATIACLSPFSEQQVRQLAGTEDVEVLPVPDPPAPEAVRDVVREADIVISDQRHKHRIDRDVLSLMRRCRLIQQPAVGFDVIDHRAAAEFGIPVANAAGYNADSVADWTIMAFLNVLRQGARGDREMREDGWRPKDLRGRELGALTVGIVGMGNIGRGVAERLAGFGSRVLYFDVVPRELPDAEAVPFDELLRRADIVSIHVPLDQTSHELVGPQELRRMRPGAVLANASRGPIVDEDALVEALKSGHLGGAALDVFRIEPLPTDSPLRRMDNVFLSPHVAGGTVQAKDKMFEVIGANIRRVLAGEQPIHVVNAAG